MGTLRALAVLGAVAGFAVSGGVAASAVIADPVTTGARQVVLASPGTADPYRIAPDQVLTAAEGIAIKQRVTALRLAPQWRWMGNYGNVYDPLAVANTPPGLGPGTLVFEITDNGLIPAWMYY